MPSPPRLTVLCIDDDVDNTLLRAQLLESLGFRVLTANSGADGLALISDASPDIVLVDYTMPGMDGGLVAECAKQIRPRLPIVMLSAHVDVPQEALRWVDCFVVKGEPIELLLGRMRELMKPVERSVKAPTVKGRSDGDERTQTGGA